MNTSRANNEELRRLRLQRSDLTPDLLIMITGRSRSLVYAWLRNPWHKGFKPMNDKDLRLIQLELGMVEPRYRRNRSD